MIIRPFEKHDLVWIKPMAQKYGSWDDIQKAANDPDKFGVITALVVVPYCLGYIYLDEHGMVLEGLCDKYSVRELIRGAQFLCKVADEQKWDLHNHKGQKPWEKWALEKLGFEDSGSERGYVRYTYQQAQEVA